MAEGRIIKALSGFYYVKSGSDIYSCKGRGVFRKRKITPLVGDFVAFDITENGEGYIQEINKRQNELIRPPIANVTQAIVVNAAVEPTFSTLLLDRFLVLVEAKGMKPMIVITKKDLADDEEKKSIAGYVKDYQRIGYAVTFLSLDDAEALGELTTALANNVTVVMGQSGVGKSTLLNTLNPALSIKTAAISHSLGRGKHTTRHVELLEVNDGLVADTPGFSALDFTDIEVEELGNCFREMRLVAAKCKFRGCLHDKEPGCAVKAAVEENTIAIYRYEHYLAFLEEIKNKKVRY